MASKRHAAKARSLSSERGIKYQEALDIVRGDVSLAGDTRNRMRFPDIVLSNGYRRGIPLTVSAACECYTKTSEHSVGVLADGRSLQFGMRYNPHIAVIGSTGSGKSCTLRNLVADYLAYGFQTIIVDGRQSDWIEEDRSGVVSLVSRTTAQHIRAIKLTRDIVDQRLRDVMALARQKSSLHPVALIVDEFDCVAENIRRCYGDGALKTVQRDIDRILRMGRETHVHVVMSDSGNGRSISAVLNTMFDLHLYLGNASRMVRVPLDIREACAAVASDADLRERGVGVAVTWSAGDGPEAVAYKGYLDRRSADNLVGYGWIALSEENMERLERLRDFQDGRVQILYGRLELDECDREELSFDQVRESRVVLAQTNTRGYVTRTEYVPS